MASPLKNKIYPNKAISELKKLIPENSHVHTMWLYSGDLELAFANDERQVTAYTSQREVLNFWATVSEAPRDLYEILLSEPFRFVLDDFGRLQNSWHRWPSPISRAALFFVLSTASEMGLVSRGALETTYLNAVSYSRVMTFKKPETLEFRLLDRHPLDIEKEAEDYVILSAGNYNYNRFDYGKAVGPEEAVINHKEIRERWEGLSPHTLLVYNYHPDLLALYDDSPITMINEYGKPTRHESLCKELIIAKR